MTVKSIGSNSRDYANPALWWADCPSNLVTSTDTWEGECYNDSEFTTSSGYDFTGVTTSSTYFASLKSASGEGFNDDADKLTNALTYNQANGVAIRKTSNYGTTIKINVQDFFLDGVQISSTGTNGGIAIIVDSSASDRVEIRNVIGLSTSATWIASTRKSCLFVNCVFIQPANTNATVAEGVVSFYAAPTIANCTVITLKSGNTTNGIDKRGSSADSMVVKNTAVFGFGTAFDSGSWGTGSDYNCTDDTSAPGANSLDNKTFSSQFEDVSSDANLDLRAKSTGDLAENGTRDQTNTSDKDILGQDRSTTAPYIGAHEVVSSSTILPISCNLTNASSSTDIDNIMVRKLLGNLTNLSASADIDNIMTRALAVSLANQSDTTAIDRLISRLVAVSLQNQSSTSDIDSLTVRDLVAVLANQSATTDISQIVSRLLSAALTNQSGTTSIDQIVERLLSAALANQSGTTDIDHLMVRGLVANLTNISSTTDIAITIAGLFNLAVSLTNQSSTADIDFFMDRLLAANLTNTSSTTDIDVVLSNLVSLAANLTNQSDTSDIDYFMVRELAASLTNASDTTAIDIVLTDLISLACSLTNQSVTTGIDAKITRDLFASITNLSSTSALEAIFNIALSVDIGNQSATSDIQQIITRSLSVDLTNQSLTSDDVAIILGVLALVASDVLSIEVAQDLLEAVITQDTYSIEIN